MSSLLLVPFLVGCDRPSRVERRGAEPSGVCLPARRALSPDGCKLLADYPPRIIHIAKGTTTVLQSCPEIPHRSWSWSPSSDAVIFSRIEESGRWSRQKYVWRAYRCDIGEDRTELLDTRALGWVAPGDAGPLQICYVDQDILLVVLNAVEYGSSYTPHVLLAKLRFGKVIPWCRPVPIPDQADATVPLAPALGAQREYAVVYVQTPHSSGRESSTYAIRLSDLQVTRLLCESRVREITGVGDADLSTGAEVGSYTPVIAGGWAFAGLHGRGKYVNRIVGIDISTNTVGLAEELPDLLGLVSVAPDGRRIVCARLEEKAGQTPNGSTRSSIWIYDRSMEDGTRLTSGQYRDTKPYWNEPLQTIIFERDGVEIWSVPISGGEPERICGVVDQSSLESEVRRWHDVFSARRMDSPGREGELCRWPRQVGWLLSGGLMWARRSLPADGVIQRCSCTRCDHVCGYITP